MPAQVARIMMSVLILGLGALLYPAIVVMEERYTSSRFSWDPLPLFWIAGFLSWMFVRFGWYLIWRTHIVRTKRRKANAVRLTFYTAALAVCLWLAFDKLMSGDEIPTILASSIAPVVGLMGTVLSYAQTPADRAALALLAKRAEVHCPNCDYNLAGLTSTRCPECGKEYPLDALLAAQAQPVGQDA